MDQKAPQANTNAVPWQHEAMGDLPSPATIDKVADRVAFLGAIAGFAYPAVLYSQLSALASALRNGTLVREPKPEAFEPNDLSTWTRSDLISYIESEPKSESIEVVFEFSGPHGNVGSVNMPLDAAMDLALQLFLAADEMSAEVTP